MSTEEISVDTKAPAYFEPSVGRRVAVCLTGQVFAVRRGNDEPILLDLPGLGASFTLFGSAVDLRIYMARIGEGEFRIKKVTDGIDSLGNQIPYPIVCDMRFDAAERKSKWRLVLPLEKA